mgnify:CR=1 FL=1
MNNDTEAALVQALISNTPEALLRLLTSSSPTEPDAAAAALVEALGEGAGGVGHPESAERHAVGRFLQLARVRVVREMCPK